MIFGGTFCCSPWNTNSEFIKNAEVSTKITSYSHTEWMLCCIAMKIFKYIYQTFLFLFLHLLLHMVESGQLSRTATGYELDGCGLIPNRGQILLLSTASKPILRPTQSPIQRVLGATSAVVKRQDRGADRSPPSIPEIKNGGAIPPLLHVCSWCRSL
jgi:hypothetical protein